MKKDAHMICRNCCTVMVKTLTGWLCERCGLQWGKAEAEAK